MMKRTPMRRRANHSGQAWPGQAIGAVSPRGLLQRFFWASISSGRISDLLKFLVPKVGESFVLDHNVESQEVAQARPRPELAGTLATILELGFCRLCLHLKISDLDHSDQKYVRVNID